MQEWLSLVSISSAIIFVLTFTITTMLHELAHALIGLAQGESPVLHHTFVTHEGLEPRARALTAAAGPIFSLAQGLVFAALVPAFERSSVLVQLFVLWMALHGLVNFFGYLIATPFAPHSDVGKVANYLNLKRPAKLALCAVGFAAQWVIGLAATRPFLQLAPAPELIMTEAGRMNHIFQIAVVPWILGAIILIVVRLPSPQWINIIYPAVSGLFSLVTWKTAGTTSFTALTSGVWREVLLWPWIATLTLVLLFFRVVLARGIRLGKRTYVES
jgi:hypothetical protein